MLNKARELMNQRESMIKEAQEILAVLGAANEATVVTNQIVINKGKVTAIETTNEEYIEQLLADAQKREARIDELKALLERERQLYKDLEFEANEEIDAVAEKRDKEIARLKKELAHKDLLLDEFRESMDEKVKRIHELELQLEELNNNYSSLDQNYIDYQDEVENERQALNDKMNGMEIGYKNKIAKLQAEIRSLKAKQVKIEVVDDPAFNEPQEKPVAKETKEEKPVTNNKPVNSPISLTYTSLQVTHDAIKAVAHDKANGVTFHFVWKAGQEKLPCYSATGARGTWSRMNGAGMYRYGKQVVEDFKQLAEEKIISRTKDGRVKTTKAKETNKPQEKPVVKEQEIKVNTTNDDPLGNTDDMEFDCFDC